MYALAVVATLMYYKVFYIFIYLFIYFIMYLFAIRSTCECIICALLILQVFEMKYADKKYFNVHFTLICNILVNVTTAKNLNKSYHT